MSKKKRISNKFVIMFTINDKFKKINNKIKYLSNTSTFSNKEKV